MLGFLHSLNLSFPLRESSWLWGHWRGHSPLLALWQGVWLLLTHAQDSIPRQANSALYGTSSKPNLQARREKPQSRRKAFKSHRCFTLPGQAGEQKHFFSGFLKKQRLKSIADHC